MQDSTAQPAAPSPGFSAPRLAEIVAAELRGRILSGALGDRALLPKQDDLLAEFGVSLPTLREALRILEAEGLIRVQRGKRGGSIVSHPTPATAAYAIATVLESNRVGLPDVAIALQEIESACLAMAARRTDRHEAVIPVLRSLNERSAAAIDEIAEYRSLAYELHSEFVASAGSPTMALLAGALEALWLAHAQDLAADAVTEAVRRAHVDAHAVLIDAVEQGESESVRSLSRAHLCEATRHSLTIVPDVAIDSSSISPGRAGRVRS